MILGTRDQYVELVNLEEGVDVYKRQVYELAEQFRISRQTVSKLLQREGIPRHGRPLSPAQVEQATELYDTGLSWSALASGLGATVAPCTLPSGRLVYGCGTVRGTSAR